MASCNNSGSTMLFGHAMPALFGQLSAYQKEITSQIKKITVKARSTPNGKLVNRTFSIHEKLHGNLAAIFDEIAQNPNVAVNDYIGSFCFRKINNPSKKGSESASIHSLGAAVDINYNLNGFIPPDGKSDSAFVMRTTNHPIVKAFLRHGWSWGGAWNGKNKDYMHFEFISGNSQYLSGEYASDNYETSGGVSFDNSGNEDRSFGFSSPTNNSAAYDMNVTCPANNEPNTVYQMTSTGERSNVTKMNDKRKEDFKSLRESLKKDSINMGRDIIESPEMYNSNILKSTQSAKQQRLPKNS